MMIHSSVLADLAAQRTRDLRAEADADRLARVATQAGAGTAAEGVERPRRRTWPWRQPGPRPA
jgi:hypothetical protein